MSARSVLGAILISLPCMTIADAPTLSIPNTPAGHALSSWLDAFNSGDSARIRSFDDIHAKWLTLDREMELRARTGGYDLLSIDKSSKLWIVFSAREKATTTQLDGALVVKADDPEVISLLLFSPAGPAPDVVTLTAAERDQVIEGAAKRLAEFYVSPKLAQKVAAALRTQQERGDYRDITNGEVLASRLTDDLRAISHDKHVSVHFSWDAVPPDPTDTPNLNPDVDVELQQRLTANNCGFEKAEHLPPNIGYLKLDLFAEPKFCASTAIAAMAFLANSDSLIIDLRDNHGGSPRMTALISSYLFAVPTHLDDSFDRRKNTTVQLWTDPYLPGRKFMDKPVFVLSSRKTFSSAELFGYDLKNLKRATVIGETTGGGAHLVGPHRLGDHFFIEVPFGGFVNPITGTDWEGTGVEPDVKVDAANALDEALKRAREQTPTAGSPR
jgi:peptidase S41-like protein